ncbi:MAG: septum formation inhibitor Maf [Acidimicrobiia bacterium]|nr:septum formation inhibitor Maf [Acidimicrobiia bacterium]MCC5954387.1 septum formation inhibitor Maf [Acidimicrobiia bacterium]
MPHPRLVLASASPTRASILRTAGFDPEIRVSGVDETEVAPDDVRAMVAALARLKATAVADRLATEVTDDEQALVVGCDSLFEWDGHPVGKPADVAEARARWRAMRGRAGLLHTGHCVIACPGGDSAEGVATSTVRFGRPTDDEIEAYLATGEPLEVAGAATIEGRSAPFIDGIEGDHTNVLGLSLPLLRTLLADLGVAITDLWVPPGGVSTP